MIIWDYLDAEIQAKYNISDEKLAEHKEQLERIMDRTFIDPEVQRIIANIDILQ